MHHQEIIKHLLIKLNQQKQIIECAHSVLHDLAEQEFILKRQHNEFETQYLYANIQEMALAAAKERIALDRYLRGEIYAN